jgi:hypothetical protein
MEGFRRDSRFTDGRADRDVRTPKFFGDINTQANGGSEGTIMGAEGGQDRAIYRGSRKHILDWTGLEPTIFLDSMNELLNGTGAVVTPKDRWKPQGYANPKETRLIENELNRLLGENYASAIKKWWLAHVRGANVPNWDLVCTCTLEECPGLVLVESKANHAELKDEGKFLHGNASKNSRENHEKIDNAIVEACEALNRVAPGIRISRDSHYQLSNRVAMAWKLASLGIPTVLMYLGFLGDGGITDVGIPLTDGKEWNDIFWQYADGMLPRDFAERPIYCGSATMYLIVRSRSILEESPKGRTPAR